MRLRNFLFYIGLIVTNFFALSSKAQAGLCPPNLDFEFGDFTNWVCKYGYVAAESNVNVVHLDNIGQLPNRHVIISRANASIDPYGGFSTLNPNGGNYSVKLGNSSGGHEAEGISYTFTIPPQATSFSLLYYYAVVFQDPNHQPWEQPRFRARIIDVATGQNLPCVSFDFVATANLPGFRRSPIDASVWYKDWTPISVNLSNYAGHTVMLEFITSDCTFTQHFGYAYMDVSSICNGVISGNYICPNTPDLTMTAPFGFQTYTWYSDNTFSTVIGNQQTITLNPPPAVGATLPVVVTPYPGFGCQDTLYANIEIATPPPAVAGPDATICKGGNVQIGGPPGLGLGYSWTPPAEVSNPSVSNPFAVPLTNNPTQYILQVTDLLTGCVNFDTTVVSTAQIDTALSYTGNDEICIGDQGPTLTVSTAVAAVQWVEQSSGDLPGATAVTYQPTATGTYYARLSELGCLDSTRVVPFTIHPIPIPSFNLNKDTGCIRISSFVMTNTSTSPDGANMNYLWTFSDGITQTTTDVTRSFNLVGDYSVDLEATTQYGCKATSSQRIMHVLTNGRPNFTYDSICTGRPVTFHNLSNENGSPRVNYLWNFNDGNPMSNLKDPFPVIYNIPPGKVDVTLLMTTLGCESDTQRLIRTVQVNRQAPGYTYHSITIPQGSTQFAHVRDSIGNYYNWRPHLLLSSYDTRYTEITAGDDITYFIDITDKHTCVTTDTLSVMVLKKPGFYLPSAFTPNGDGLNDLVRPYLVGMKGLASFAIYNRWGNLIYYTEKYGEGWDGKNKNVTQASGVYIWILRFYNANNQLVTEKGSITLIR